MSLITDVADRSLQQPPVILLIDDSPEFVYLIRRYAQYSGCHFQSTSLLDNGIALAQRVRPALIVIVVMRDGTNDTVVHLLRTHPTTQDVPLVGCSAQSDGGYGWRESIDYYLVKPVLYDDFRAILINAGLTPLHGSEVYID